MQQTTTTTTGVSATDFRNFIHDLPPSFNYFQIVKTYYKKFQIKRYLWRIDSTSGSHENWYSALTRLRSSWGLKVEFHEVSTNFLFFIEKRDTFKTTFHFDFRRKGNFCRVRLAKKWQSKNTFLLSSQLSHKLSRFNFPFHFAMNIFGCLRIKGHKFFPLFILVWVRVCLHSACVCVS